MKFPFTKENLHHAYIIEGDKKDICPRLFTFFEEELQIPTRGNPDFIYQEFELFGINDARNLKELHYSKPVAGDKKLLVTVLGSITTEAQNALLKVLEEPVGHSHFFFISPSSDLFIPTIISRTEVLKKEVVADAALSEEAYAYLRRTPVERLELVRNMIEEKDSAKALSLLDKMEQVYEESLREGAGEQGRIREALEEIIRMRSYLRSKSASIKMIMEHLSLTLPAIK